jgi:hypothetical protein
MSMLKQFSQDIVGNGPVQKTSTITRRENHCEGEDTPMALQMVVAVNEIAIDNCPAVEYNAPRASLPIR